MELNQKYENIIIDSRIFKAKYLIFKLFFFLILIIFSITNNYLFINDFYLKNFNLFNNDFIEFNNGNLIEYLNNSEYFKLTFFNYYLSFKFRIIKIQYNIGFYDKNNNLILPSNLALYNDLHIICSIAFKNKSIDSLANIYKNKYFNCIEYFKINEKIKFGIKIYKKNINKFTQYYTIFFYTEKIISYNYLNYIFDDIFDPLFINNYYNLLTKKMNENKEKKKYLLKKSYIKYPSFALKILSTVNKDKWVFKNIYRHYFCFCIGYNCLKEKLNEYCKYFFYVYIIDNNKKIYDKTDYLFIDFIYSELSSDDTFPLFKRMLQEKLPVHYITEKMDIYNQYCMNIKECLIILPVYKNKKPINGDFLEKYLTLFLKIKVVVSGRGTTFNTNLFYNIDYITYISVGHGVCYFKYFLYNEYRIYGIKKNNKLLLPPSEKIISLAKKYGWEDKDIIKINLPRWDKYNSNETEIFNFDESIKNNSIFIMFTWRDIIKQKNISTFYLENIMKLINNDKLNLILKIKNISLYLSFHRLIDKKYIKKFDKNIKTCDYIKIIKQNEISECLSKTNLVISDFSSIIFDFMYRNKPFIMYIPDGNDPQNKEIYKKDYYELIELLKNDTIYFENKFFDINETINKIIYYINNNFILDSKLIDFYESFGFKKENSINKLIYYLKYLK